MKKFLFSFALFAIPSILISCKKDVKETNIVEKTSVPIAEEPLVSEEERENQVNSVLAKMMATTEVSTYVRHLVTTGNANMLLVEKGPFTILAPSNDVFENLTKEENNSFSDPINRTSLSEALRSHIVQGNFDTASLVKKIKNSGGTYSLLALSGDTIEIYKKGNDLLVKNKQGIKGVIGKSDINGTNGIIHIMDALFVN